MPSSSIISPPAMNMDECSQWRYPPDVGSPTLNNSSTSRTQINQTLEPDPAHQASLDISAPRKAAMPKRKGRRYHAQRYQYGVGKHLSYATPMHTSSSDYRKPEKRFSCTVCTQSFRNESEWKRHEAGVHGYNDREWICMSTETFMFQPKCVFCLEPMDSIDHLNRHAIAACTNKCTIERTFPGKDLIKQHVLHAHLAGEPKSVRKNFTVPQE